MFSLLALLASFAVQISVAQESGWIYTNQVNATLCQWMTPRAAVVRDTWYIDGGYLWWEPGLSDGTYGGPVADDNPLGLVYVLNFSTSFKTSENISNVFSTPISKASNNGFANNVAPQYIDGGMFANDYEWFTYGGMLRLTEAWDPPAADSIPAYYVYASGPPKLFEAGFVLKTLPDAMTRYITDGAAASAPSENLGFYFSGLRAADFGNIAYLPGPQNSSLLADTESTTLIQLNMTVQAQEQWSNFTLPPTVLPRANAEIVWVPVGDQGILVAIGGVINPSFANIAQADNATETAQSTQISPTFMSTVSIYDIAGKTWYEQATTGGPGQLTQGCAVLASAQDDSSHNIYWYGGFDGLDTSTVTDDVWILSIPSFVWIKVYSGVATHARAGHRCTKPYPDQMFVIGGYPSLSSDFNCVDGFLQIFNLSSTQWLDTYDPAVWSNYSVPSVVYTAIGGSSTGSATQTTPSPSGFSNSSLSSLFKSPYDSSKIKTWYPYPVISTSTNRTTLPTVVPKPGGTPKYLAPLLGVVLGLFVVTLFVLGFLLFRHSRSLKRQAGSSEGETMDRQHRVMAWMRGTPQEAKSPPTVTTTDDTFETPSSPYSHEETPAMQEVGGNQVHELMDTSKPVEMPDTTPTGFIPMRAKELPVTGLASSPSSASRTSTISGTSNRPSVSPIHSPISRTDSPPLGRSSIQSQTRVVSDVSGISESERGHLRGISETSVSTDGVDFATPMENPLAANISPRPAPAPHENRVRNVSRDGGIVSPLTPPGDMDELRGGYVGGATGPESPQRRSNFEERL